MKIRGVNKAKGTKRRWGSGFVHKWPNGTATNGRWLLKGSKARGDLMKRKCILWDGEWVAEGRWIKCD